MPTSPAIPKKSSGSYRAARLIYDTGSKTEAELIEAVDFGLQRNLRAAFDYAIKSGWLRILPDGRYALTDATLEYFETEPVEDVREIVKPSSIDKMARKPYSPPKRLPRDDEPKWSERDVPNFYRG